MKEFGIRLNGEPIQIKFKLISFGTGKFGRVLGEVFVSPDYVGQNITEQTMKNMIH